MSSNPSQPAPVSRRTVIQTGVAGAAAALGANLVRAADAPAPTDPTPAAAAQSGGRVIKKDRINQTVCKWCYDKKVEPFDKLCAEAAKMGYRGVDLVDIALWPALKKHNLVGTMTPSHTIEKGLNRKENWEQCLAKIRTGIEASAEAGYPNVICFSGNRAGMSDEEGAKNCAEALKQVVGLAEEKKVTICMELLNSKVNHKDYMCDHTAWGVQVCKLVGSDRFKLLYDIYHMQIMEGDVIRTLKANKDYIGHYHTGGVPGRQEIDESQELYYPAIMKAILETGYKGWVGQEFIPEREPLASLRQAGAICDV
jgi:hydroxypyruvate isomerase